MKANCLYCKRSFADENAKRKGRGWVVKGFDGFVIRQRDKTYAGCCEKCSKKIDKGEIVMTAF